ncbi:MAG: metal transporter permease [Rhodospirillales bacterium]|nr:metal transporter permease [Rhodospirillales bacterium]
MIALALPVLLALALLVPIHAALGLHVLRRRVVFADLALAQLAALGATAAVAAGHAPGELATQVWAFLAASSGAVLLTLAPRLGATVGREAMVGIAYVVATAATVLVVDGAPQGAEHVKRVLVGDLLSVSLDSLPRTAILYAAIGTALALFHRKLRAPDRSLALELGFYLGFAAVVTSSVAMAGVLVVFSLLIMPAVAGLLLARRFAVAFAIALAAGSIASVAGVAAAFTVDRPLGASLVLALAATVVLAIMLRAVRGVAKLRLVWLSGYALAAALATASAWWLVAPSADQPLAPLVARWSGAFLSDAERNAQDDSRATERKWLDQLAQLDARERAARTDGAPLDDEMLRRIASFQRSYAEMARGERFVVETLTATARERARWPIGLTGLFAATLIGVAVYAARRRPLGVSSSNSSERLDSIVPPSCSTSTMVTARR